MLNIRSFPGISNVEKKRQKFEDEKNALQMQKNTYRLTFYHTIWHVNAYIGTFAIPLQWILVAYFILFARC